MAITKRQFIVAAARLFFDMINADGVIDDNEILLFEGIGQHNLPNDLNSTSIDLPYLSKEANNLVRQGGLRKKYGITIDDIQAANAMTTSSAIRILSQWQDHEEKQEVKFYPQTPYRAKNVQNDLRLLSKCDRDRDVSEAKLLAIVGLCLNDGVPKDQRAIPVSYTEQNMRFARKEIIYLEGKYDEGVNRSIRQNRTYIESLLALYGYQFVYIPAIIDFLKKKDKIDLLKLIIMFSKPFYYKDEMRAEEFVKDLQGVTTADFTNSFSREANLDMDFPPSLLVKVKNSTIENVDEKNQIKRTNYADFIVIPVNDSVVDAVKRLPDNILQHTDYMVSLVRKTHKEKLYSKGIHKTLIDYVVHRSSTNTVRRVVFDMREKEKYVDLVGVDGGRVKLQPKEFALYVTSLIYSISSSHGILKNEDSSDECARVKDTFRELYEKSAESRDTLKNSNLYQSLSVLKSNINTKIKGVRNLKETNRYCISNVGNYLRVEINPNIVFVRNDKDNTEMLLIEWIRNEKIRL